MLKITHPTTLRPVLIARLLEQQGSPLAPLAEEIYDLAIAYRIDAAFALAQCMVESQLGCLPLAQVNRNAALVRVALTRLAAPAAAGACGNRVPALSASPRAPAPSGPLRHAEETEPILPTRYGDVYGSGYITYPGWLAGLEEYFRVLRYVFVDAWREEKVEQIAHAYLASTPGRKPAPGAPRVVNGARHGGSGQSQAPTLHHQALVSQQEISAYARRIARYRAAFGDGRSP